MTRLWILNHYANTPSYPGPIRHHELAKRLVANGFDVTIIASAFRGVFGSHPMTGDETVLTSMIDGVRHVWTRAEFTYRTNDAARMRNMAEYAWRTWRGGRTCFDGRVPPPDLVLGTSPHLLAPLAAWLLSRRFRVPFVMEVRDLWPETFVAFGLFPRWHPIVLALRLLERFLYRRARRIVSLLPEAWRYIERSGVPADRVVWVPNGITVEDEVPQPPASASGEPFTLLYAGTHGRANALDELIDAAALLQGRNVPVRILLVGDGPAKAGLVERAEALKLRNVEFRGELPREEIRSVTRRADAFVALLEDTYLYRYGTSLNKVFDYMGDARPIVLAGRMAKNYVQEAACGLTPPPRDAEALAEAIEELVALPEDERRRMGLRGRRYVEVHHNWDHLAQRLAETLGELIRK